MKQHIFVFEDNPEFIIRLRSLFGKQDMKIEHAANYTQAIEKLNSFTLQECPQIALLDIKQDITIGNLPQGVTAEKAGFAIADNIRKLSLPMSIIFMTSYPQSYERQAAAYAPFAFIDKGIENFELEISSRIDALLHASDIRQENLRSGKFCITADGLKFIIDIENLLYFHGGDGQNTFIKISSRQRKLTFGVTPGIFYNCLRDILSRQKKTNPFYEVVNGQYVNFDKIVAFDGNNVYFDHEGSQLLAVNGNNFLGDRYTRITTNHENRIVW